MKYFQVQYFAVGKFLDSFADKDYKEIVTKSEIAEAVELLGSIHPDPIFNKHQIQVAISSTNNVIWQKAFNSGAGQL